MRVDEQEQVRIAVEQVMVKHRIPGMSLAVTTSDRLLFAGGFGFANLTTKAPATESTQYLWFSLTKIATATSTMRLVDKGRRAPVTPFAQYGAGYKASATVRQLLSHTAGLASPIPVRWVRPAHEPAPLPREFLDALLARHA